MGARSGLLLQSLLRNQIKVSDPHATSLSPCAPCKAPEQHWGQTTVNLEEHRKAVCVGGVANVYIDRGMLALMSNRFVWAEFWVTELKLVGLVCLFFPALFGSRVKYPR